MTTRSIAQIIDRQIRQWQLHQELRRLSDRDSPAPLRPTITISRELGSGAEEMAEQLARRLGFTVHGVDLIDLIAIDKGIERRIVEQLDERTRSEIELWVQGMLKQRLFSRDEYLVSLIRAVRTLASVGGVIIVGRGAHLLLAERCCLRVRVVAGEETRIRCLCEREGIGRDEARRRIAESDAQRKAFLHKLHRAEVNDPHLFDLVLNADQLPVVGMVDIILTALEVSGLFEECRSETG